VSKIDRKQAEVGNVIPQEELDKCSVRPSQFSMDHRCHAILIIDLNSEYRQLLVSVVQRRFPDAVSYEHSRHPRWLWIAPHKEATKPWPEGFYEQVCALMNKKPQSDPRVAQNKKKSRQGFPNSLFMR
jgi:hypothetical protein